MAKCKDCVHVDVCQKTRIMNPAYDYAPKCNDFKDRSRFVDITEIKQNVIRPLCNRCAAQTKCQTCLACALEIRKYCKHYKQAEQALKERGENEK